MITNQDILLATEVDKTNQPITIYYCSDVSKSLSFSLMFEVYAQMLEQNLVILSVLNKKQLRIDLAHRMIN